MENKLFPSLSPPDFWKFVRLKVLSPSPDNIAILPLASTLQLLHFMDPPREQAIRSPAVGTGSVVVAKVRRRRRRWWWLYKTAAVLLSLAAQ